MRSRISWRATGSLVGAGLMAFAGGPGESAAQTRADSNQERLSLSAAMEEVRRSPFHTAADATGSREPLTSQSGIDGATAPHPGPQEGSVRAPVVALTYVAAGASHLAATFLFFGCALDESYNASATGCFLAPLVPLAAVSFASAAGGANLRKALGASTIGLAGGGAAYLVALLFTENIDNANPLVATVASSLTHAAITTALLRRW